MLAPTSAKSPYPQFRDARSRILGVALCCAGSLALVAGVGCGDSATDAVSSSTGTGGSAGGTSDGGNDGSGGAGAQTSVGGGGQGGDAAGGSGGSTSIDPLHFAEEGGMVAVEAEHFISNDDQGTPRAWYLTTPAMPPSVTPDPDEPHADSASGTACVEGLPDTRVTHDDPIVNGESFFSTPGAGPELSYRINFATTGKYYVWVRAYSTGTEDNGAHVGIDGANPASGERVQFCAGKNQWTWSSAQRDSGGSACGQPNTIFLDVTTPGEHIIAFSMREDGFEFDKFIMTTDENFTPQGAGPAEKLFGE